MDIQMTPKRPYLVRAMYDWLVDNDLTPHLVVDAMQTHVEVPQEHVQEGQIVLNVHPAAVVNFSMDLEHVSFEARFAGVPRRIWVPMAAVLAIYARENGAGTIFEPEPGLTPKASVAISDSETTPAAGDLNEQTSPNEDGGKAGPKKGKPSLRVVK